MTQLFEPNGGLQGAERLALLYRVSQTFNSSLDLDEVLSYVMDEVIAITRAERGFLMLHDSEGRLVFRAARGMDQHTIAAPEFQVSRGVIERVAQAGQPLLTSNAQSDAWLSARQSVVVLGLRSILCVPLQIKGNTLGLIYVDNRLQAGIFTPADLDLLTAIASSAAVAIENARLYRVAVDKGRMERELQMARELQTRLLPRQTPSLPGWAFAAHWQPAREVAGDFYDFIWTHAPGAGGERQLGIVVCDVADKGMAAALFMALVRSIVRASMVHAHSPAGGIADANRLICADASNGMFATLFYAQIDPASGDLLYVNAGHNPPLHYHAAGGQLAPLARTCMALGIEAETPVEQRRVHLEPGDFVLLYTDGLTEAIDLNRQEFGEERLRQVLLDQRHAAPVQMVDALQRAVAAFTGDAAPFDDSTLVIAKRL